ncbi:MAG: TetR/AcrR family transcriptional regulator [Methanoregula sp.]|jgi:AcrR family transcriptional regulator
MTEAQPDKKTAILDTALVLFTTRGFQGTPTSLISREAGVATGTLFFYFATKEDLIDELYRVIKSEAGAAINDGIENKNSIKEKICRVGKNGISWGIKNPEKMQFMEQFAHSPFVSTTAHEEGMSHFLFLQELIREGIKEGVIRNYDPDLLCMMLAASLSGLIARVTAEPDPKKRGLLVGQGMEFLWNGIAA